MPAVNFATFSVMILLEIDVKTAQSVIKGTLSRKGSWSWDTLTVKNQSHEVATFAAQPLPPFSLRKNLTVSIRWQKEMRVDVDLLGNCPKEFDSSQVEKSVTNVITGCLGQSKEAPLPGFRNGEQGRIPTRAEFIRIRSAINLGPPRAVERTFDYPRLQQFGPEGVVCRANPPPLKIPAHPLPGLAG
jgi:hypothetical protein